MLTCSHQADIGIACASLMITKLLQVDNRLHASWLPRLLNHKLDTSCFNTLQQVCENASSKMYNLHQVSGVSGCVIVSTRLLCTTVTDPNASYCSQLFLCQLRRACLHNTLPLKVRCKSQEEELGFFGTWLVSLTRLRRYSQWRLEILDAKFPSPGPRRENSSEYRLSLGKQIAKEFRLELKKT